MDNKDIQPDGKLGTPTPPSFNDSEKRILERFVKWQGLTTTAGYNNTETDLDTLSLLKAKGLLSQAGPMYVLTTSGWEIINSYYTLDI